jgi:hypothetical protein
MRTATIIVATFLILKATPLGALDPPVKLWERWYYQPYDGAFFFDIELTDSDSLFITGSIYDYTVPLLDGYSALLMNQDGDVLWEVHHDWYTGRGYDGEILPDGSYIITGRCVERPTSTYSLFLMKIDMSGSIEWTKIYDYPDTREEGFGVTCLPDGGYAVCGRVYGTGSGLAGQAWILRTDANGDTLWTDIWGTYPWNYAKKAYYDEANDRLVVAVFGTSDELPLNCPHLLFYDLDGTYLFGTTYYPELSAEVVRGFCRSYDGGFTFLSRYGTGTSDGTLTHTNSNGEVIWSEIIPAQAVYDNDNLGLGFAGFDGGYICCGWTGYWGPPDFEDQITESVAETDTGSTEDGWLVRFDTDGNILWDIENEMEHDNHFYTAVQLPEGGYFAAGTYTGSGYLVRYSAETGIEWTEPEQVVQFDISPNPFSSSLSIGYSLPEPGEVDLSVYDLTGRLVVNLESNYVVVGEHVSTWSPGPDVPDGCYLIVLETPETRAVRRCVLLR